MVQLVQPVSWRQVKRVGSAIGNVSSVIVSDSSNTRWIFIYFLRSLLQQVGGCIMSNVEVKELFDENR